MTRFSLIVATLGRDRDLAVLFESLLAQRVAEIEVIVVDQNRDERLAPILAPFAGRLALTHLRTERAHANAARNLGLRAARGEIVAFPDDDCWLPEGVLARVEAAFADRSLAVLTGPAAAPEGGLGSGRWRDQAGAITRENVWTSVIEFNLWLRRDVALALGGFDERLGPGTPWGSAEGNDLVARALAAGHRALYDPALRVVHPDKRMSDIALARARVYGAGLGVALRRHAPLPVAARFAVRPLGGALLSLARGDVAAARYYAATLRGRLSGFFAKDAAR
jgi:glycosyltransferase involved in cell wall biosynthesis